VLPDTTFSGAICLMAGVNIMIDKTAPSPIEGSVTIRRPWTINRVYSVANKIGAIVQFVVRHFASVLSHLLPTSNFARIHRRKTFQVVYRNKQWGTDGKSQFFSGVGSRGGPATAYVDAMAPIISIHFTDLGDQATIVDLGCGDFSVGARLLERLPRLRYVGCDVVPEIVEHNKKKYGNDLVQFRTLDMVSQDLPDGDICLVRQVFQHLSNRDIACVLPKLRNYRFVYVTEGQPFIRVGKPNPDKPANANVRFDWRTGYGRGVELDQPPWNLLLEAVLRVPGPIDDKEVILTHRVRFSS
jgi:SAM-dependent methyltransferase